MLTFETVLRETFEGSSFLILMCVLLARNGVSLPFPHADVSVNFMESSYSVTEGEGQVTVCVQMIGYATVPLTVTLSTSQDTALGMYSETPNLVTMQSVTAPYLLCCMQLASTSTLSLSPSCSHPLTRGF